MSAPHQSFFLDGEVVGGFEAIPSDPGIYAYMPFRGIGHLRMVEEKKKGLSPRCDFRDGDTRVSFAVEEIIGPRTIRLGDFARRKVPIQPPQTTTGSSAPGRV